jgi:C4-dicarboxylate-specific signal transduction histidine kinase
MPKPPPIVGYGAAALSVLAALIVARLLGRNLSGAPVSLFLCAVMFSAWFGGVMPGLLSVVLAHLAFMYYVLPPTFLIAVDVKELPRLLMFSVSALFVWSLSAAQRRATESLAKTNEALRQEMAERKRAEEAMRQAQSDLAHVARVTTLGEMAASIAHEVDQPLSGVIINATASLRFLANPTPDLGEVRDGLQAIARDGRRASDVIGRIRTLARRAPAQRALLDVNVVIREVVALAEGEARRAQAEVRTDLAEDVPRVLGDSVQVQQVVLNLLLNGLDAMHAVDGPRVLLISTETEKDAWDRVHVAVRDSGTGIDPEVADRLFEAFCTTKPHGMGMGLSISRSIVAQHGGRLWAAPNDGPGTTFHFTV